MSRRRLHPLTPTERRIFNLLSDGEPHPMEEVDRCIEDVLATANNRRNHISNLRAKLKIRGMSVMFNSFNGRSKVGGIYRLVKLVTEKDTCHLF